MAGDDKLVVESITGADIDLDIAGPGGRSYAFVIDFHIRLLLALAWFVAVPLVLRGAINLTASAESFVSGYWLVLVLPAAAIYLLYHPVLEIAMKGSTPGKRMAGVRIVDRNGGIPTAGALLIRNVFRLIDSLPAMYLIGLVTTIWTAQSVRIGDLAAGTVLVYQDRQKKASFDRMAALHSSQSDPARVELIQDVLARWSGLDTKTRRELGAKLLAPAGIDSLPDEDDDLRAEIAGLLG